MSVIYTAHPLIDFYQTQGGVEWLKAYGLNIAPKRLESRATTPQEIQMALDYQLYDVKVIVDGEHWIADVSEKRTFTPEDIFRPKCMTVRGSGYSGIDNPITLAFDGSYELIKSLLYDLANLCGPLVLLSDGEDPELIEARPVA